MFVAQFLASRNVKNYNMLICLQSNIQKSISHLCDTFRSSIERTLGCLRLFVGRGDASKAEDQKCDGEAHDDVGAVDAVN